jgi:hypothetical protein
MVTAVLGKEFRIQCASRLVTRGVRQKGMELLDSLASCIYAFTYSRNAVFLFLGK